MAKAEGGEVSDRTLSAGRRGRGFCSCCTEKPLFTPGIKPRIKPLTHHVNDLLIISPSCSIPYSFILSASPFLTGMSPILTLHPFLPHSSFSLALCRSIIYYFSALSPARFIAGLLHCLLHHVFHYAFNHSHCGFSRTCSSAAHCLALFVACSISHLFFLFIHFSFPLSLTLFTCAFIVLYCSVAFTLS